MDLDMQFQSCLKFYGDKKVKHQHFRNFMDCTVPAVFNSLEGVADEVSKTADTDGTDNNESVVESLTSQTDDPPSENNSDNQNDSDNQNNSRWEEESARLRQAIKTLSEKQAESGMENPQAKANESHGAAIPVSNEIPEVSNEIPEVSNEIPEVSNETPPTPTLRFVPLPSLDTCEVLAEQADNLLREEALCYDE